MQLAGLLVQGHLVVVLLSLLDTYLVKVDVASRDVVLPTKRIDVLFDILMRNQMKCTDQGKVVAKVNR